MVNDAVVIPPTEPDESARLRQVRDLAGEWLSLAQVGARTGCSLNQVRKMLAERELVGLRIGPGGPHVPAAFLVDNAPLPSLKGTVTVLADGGMNDVEAIEWLFTKDTSLPVAGTPVENLHAGFKTEIRRRAMERAF